MANNNNPHGLQPLGTGLSGGPLILEAYNALAAYATAIFRYDAVNRVSGGGLQAGGVPGTVLYSGVSMEYGAASVLTTHNVIISPDALYECQAVTALTAAQMGLNANLILNAGSITTKLSGHCIDDSTAAITGTLDLHLLKAYATLDNAYGAFARVEVVFNKSRLAALTAGV